MDIEKNPPRSTPSSRCLGSGLSSVALAAFLAAALGSCGGSDSAAPAPRPPPDPMLVLALPNLADATPVTLTVGMMGSVSFTNSGGGSLTGCAPTGALPAGLALSRTSDNSSCQISGAPMSAAAVVTITVTASNATGPDATPATVRITVVAAPRLAAPDLADAPDAMLTVGQRATIPFTNSGGGSLTGCAPTGALPAGLALSPTPDSSSCQITGAPMSAAAVVTITVTASNAAGPDATPATVRITVAAAPRLAAPDLADAPDAMLTVGQQATIPFTNSGGGSLTGCASTDALPAGLALSPTPDSSSCQITGAPMSAAAAVTITVTASNAAGPDATPATVSIAVGLDVPTSGDLVVIGPAGVVSPNSVAIATFDVDQANGGIKFESVTNTSAPDGSAKMKYSVDSASGEVTVTITRDTSGVSFFTTLFTSDISREDVVRDLRRFDGGRISFELQSDEWGAYGASGKSDGLVFKVDHFIPNNGPRFCGCDQSIDVSGAGTAWTKFTVDVDDMAGSSRMGNARLNLELVKTSFVLWPNVDLQRLVSGSTITGATELTFKIRNVKWEPPGSAPDLANAAASTLELGVEVSGSAAIAFANSGGPPASGGCTATGLPSGLAVGLTPDGSSCQVSGTPNAPGAATVTVTATDSKGRASSATVMITVADSTAPVVTAPAPTDLSGGASRVNVQSGEDGTAYILVLPRDNARTLTAAQVKAMAAAPGADARVVGVKGGEGLAAAIAGLAASTDYTAYIVVTDAAGNDSALVEANFSTTATADQADPTVTEDATMRVVRAGSVSLTLTANESSDLYALALPSADAAPGAAAIKSPSTGALAGTAYAAASAATAVTVDGLAAGTAYIVYFIATDTAGNDSTVGMTPQLSTNTAPVANAGADQDVAADAMVTLTGTGTDAEDDAAGTALSYAWAQTAGTTVALSGAATATASFDAGEASDDGETLTFELTVTDSAGDTHTDEVDITVAPALGGVAPHASISLHAAGSAPDISASYGTPVTIFDGTFMNLFTEPFTYEHGAAEHDEGTGQVRASVKASGDSARGDVIEFTTGTENQAVLGIGEDRNPPARADVDLSAYTDGLLQFDLRVTDAPDSSDATFVFNIRHTPSGMDTTEPGARPIGGQAEFGLNRWRTVRVDLAEEPWASGVTWDSVDALQASPLWDHGAGATVQLDNIIIYPPPGPAPTPMLTGVDDAKVEATTVEINLTSDVAGTAYVAVLANDATAPDAAAVKAAVAGTGGVVAKASGPATAGTQATVPLAGLMASTMYDAYVVVEGTGGGLSAVIKVDLTTAAPPTPMLTAVANANVEATTADINLTSDVAGTAYVAVLENDAAAPTAADVVGAVVAPGAIFATGSVAVAAAMPATVPLTGLTGGTMYDAYVVVQGEAGGLSAVMKVDVDTPPRSPFDLQEENDAFAFVVGTLYTNSEYDDSPFPDGAEIPLLQPNTHSVSACTLVSIDGGDVDAGTGMTPGGLSLPEELMLQVSSDKNFCSFTATPTEYTPLRVYGVRATVERDSDSQLFTSIAEIAFKVATQAEPDFDIPFLVLERGVDYTAAPYALVVNRGGFVETCVHHDDSAPLPTGLVIGLSAKVGETSGGADLADTCQITGMASATLDLTDSDGSPNAYAFNTDATKGAGTKVQANYYVVAAATAGALTPEARPSGERLRTFYSAGGNPFPDAYGGRYFEGIFGGVELRFPSAGTITRCRLSDESEPLPAPFAVAPNSNGSGCIIGPRVAHSTMAPWTSFGPTDFQVIASSSQATAEPRALRIEAILETYSDPVLRAPTFPSGGTAGKVVIPMGNAAITPIPFPSTGGKLSGTWRHGCFANSGTLPAGLGVRIATEEDAGAVESLKEGQTCVIHGTPGTVAAEASIQIGYPNRQVGGSGTSNGFITFTIEVTAP